MALRKFSDDEWDGNDPGFEPMTAAQARLLSQKLRSVSPWRVIAAQVIVGVLVALLGWVFTGQSSVGWSAAYGALVVVVPGALFARGLLSKASSLNAVTAAFGVFLWELVKIVVSVGMLFAAPQVVVNLDWLALLGGLALTMMMYWVALRWHSPPKKI